MGLSVVIKMGAGPRPATVSVSPTPFSALEQLIADLRSNGVTVALSDEITQPFFAVPAKILEVNGDTGVQVFEFPDRTAIEHATTLVAPDGNTINNIIPGWASLPHFFRRDNLIVLYVGANPMVLTTLRIVLGPQFAGT